MRKTKIICTLGPSTDKEGVLRELIANGMNVARFNFSHGSHEEHLGRLEKLKALREELGKPVAALLDTKGPEIRLKDFKNGVENLVAGQTFTLTTRDVEGTNEICSITYKDLPMDVEPNGTIMLDDGLIKLQIQTVNDTDIVCTVLNNGKIKNKKGVNVPGVHLSMPYMSQRDKDDIIFGIQQGYDFIAASFVRTAQDVYDIRNLLNQYDSNIRIIAKIENREGVNNIDSILAAADAVMVARGDLGVEIDFTELPGIQKTIIDRSFSFGKPIVTATQMLDSMIVNPRPTRAEISDVANAIYDGTSAIMLSGETAAGAYPVEALKTMSAIAERTEQEGFHLRGRMTQGNIHKMTADTTQRTTVEVKRKFRDVRSNQFLQGVIGGKFQVANQEDFSDSLTIHVIPHLKDNKFHVVHPRYTGKYRYFRYLSPDWSRGNMAELYTFNAAGDTLKHKRLIGNFHVRPWCGPENLFDGNVLSFYDSHDVYGVWYGWELEQPENVARIVFLPRNDDNFIREGEEYELFYWNHGTWMSLGRKTGNFEAVLKYDNVPAQALFRLHNRTKGSEERIFTYEDGKQIWW